MPEIFPGDHVRGLACEECGHEWPGHAVVAGAYEYCPRCWDAAGGDGLWSTHGLPVGREYDGSVVVPGCHTHAAPLPCVFCGGDSVVTEGR